MLEETQKFYCLTKIEEEFALEDSHPTSHVKIFKKSYPRFETYSLTSDQVDGLDELLRKRESVRRFSEKPLKLFELSALLSTYRILDFDRAPERRTYPSGGARFPIEIYVVNFNMSEIPKGIFHMSIDSRSLSLLNAKDYSDERRLFCSDFIENASVSVIFTSVIARSEVKYKHLAYPASLIEIGHIAQNFLLAASELGLGACPVIGQVNEFVADELDLTQNELPLYAISFGRKE